MKKPIKGWLVLMFWILGSLPAMGWSSQGSDIIEGRVVAISGTEVTIAVDGNVLPQTGWSVDLFYITSQGRELPVGQWEVSAVSGRNVSAVKVKGVGNAREGLKALFRRPQTQAAQPAQTGRSGPAQTATPAAPVNVSPGPGGAGKVSDLFSDAGPGIFADVGDPRARGLAFDDYLANSQAAEAAAMPAAEPPALLPEPPVGWPQSLLDNPEPPRLGVGVTDNDSLTGQAYGAVPMGVRILEVLPGSPAARAGLEVGDIVVAANGIASQNSAQFVRLVKESSGGLHLTIHRSSEIVQTTINLQK
ncbi:MAG: PDZ domain-containing protein [Syntrophotaleaceae bacterium]